MSHMPSSQQQGITDTYPAHDSGWHPDPAGDSLAFTYLFPSRTWTFQHSCLNFYLVHLSILNHIPLNKNPTNQSNPPHT